MDAVMTDGDEADDSPLFAHNMWSGSQRVVDQSTILSEEFPEAASPLPGGHCVKSDVLTRIESIFEDISDVLLNERGQMSIIVRRRAKPQLRAEDVGDVHESGEFVVERQLCFPGGSEKEAWQFTVVTRLLELIHEALRNDTVLSKRDIYYRDPALFNKQSTVDRYVDDIAYTFSVPRSGLNITAVAKGLITGAVTFTRRDGSTLSAAADDEGILIHSMRDILSATLTNAACILVVEKEATFRSIAASPYWQEHSAHGILVTAKGYPDIATRALLHFLSTASPQNGFASPPVYGLVDFDTDGLAIFATFKHGSTKQLSHDTVELTLPGMQWLGLRSSSLTMDGGDTHASQGLLALTRRDRRRAKLMLAWDVIAGEAEMKVELQRMLMLGTKAELQLLDASPNGMAELLASSLPTCAS